jgi:hypothetical protein
MKTTIEEKDRVRQHTSESSQRRIDYKTAESVRFYAAQPRAALEQRITELDSEWDIERAIEANASTLALTGLVLGLTVNRRWLWLTGGVLGFLLQHAVQGWCPPVPVLRRMGVRTRREIDREKFALKVLRGDFDHLLQERCEGETRARADAVRVAVEA